MYNIQTEPNQSMNQLNWALLSSKIKCELPHDTAMSVDLMSNLSLPNKLIDDIANRSTKYARGPTKVKLITRQDMIYFLACYYYMGYCRLLARSDYWKQQLPNSCLLSH